MTRAVAVANLLFGLLVVAAGTALLADSARLPPPRFDILGSAAVPRALCLLVIAMALPLMVRAVLALRQGTFDEAPDETLPPRRPALAVAALALACLYVASLQNGWLGYGLATTAFLIVLAGLLSGGRPKPLAIGTVVAVVLGFGGDYLFTSVFLIDLP